MTLLFAALIAAAPLAGAKLQHDAEEHARGETTDLLRALCPEQCVLLSVSARVDEEDAGGDPTPGFEAPGARTVPVLRSISAGVLVDERLPAGFRSRVRTLVAQKLGGAGVPVSVQVSEVAFPPRNPPPYVEPPPPKAPDKPAEADKKEAQPPPPPVSSRIVDKLVEAAPLLATAILLAAVLLVLGALFFFAARRPVAEADWTELPPEQPAAPEAQPEAFPAQRLRRLCKQLADDRRLRNDLMRDALGKGEHGLVARWVRELGDFLLDDLRGDEECAQALAAVAAEVARPADPAARVAALQDLEGRALAARLARVRDADTFAFLEGVRPDAFVAALRGLSPGAQELVLRLAPSHLRASALKELPAGRRQELAVAWARNPEVTAMVAHAAADELRARLAELHAGGSDADRAIADLLDSLPREEQDALVEKLRREADGRAASAVLTESSIVAAPRDLLRTAALRVAPERLLAYLTAADGAIRTHVLEACPPRLRKELEEELALGAAIPREDFLAARRELIARLRDEAESGGIAVGDLRSWRPRVVSAP
jgi:flagellar motor switch protein FliG